MSEQERICSSCEKSFPETEEYFHLNKANSRGLQLSCKACRNEAKALYIQHNRELERERKKRETQKLRLCALTHYSKGIPTCACCGERTIQFLALDHIDGNGAKHRREMKLSGGSHIYRWVIRNDFPEIFQVLCHNCNSAKGHYGECPHEAERRGNAG